MITHDDTSVNDVDLTFFTCREHLGLFLTWAAELASVDH